MPKIATGSDWGVFWQPPMQSIPNWLRPQHRVIENPQVASGDEGGCANSSCAIPCLPFGRENLTGQCRRKITNTCCKSAALVFYLQGRLPKMIVLTQGWPKPQFRLGSTGVVDIVYAYENYVDYSYGGDCALGRICHRLSKWRSRHERKMAIQASSWFGWQG